MAKNKLIFFALAFLLLLIGQTQAQEWTRKFNGFNNPSLQWTSSTFQGRDVVQTNDGGYILAGIQSYPTGAPRDYPNLVKVNAQGFNLWHKSYFSDNANPAFFVDISLVEMPSGNLLLAGIDLNTIRLIQTDSQGDTIWTTTYPCHCTQMAAPIFVSDIKIQATIDGNYILAVTMTPQLGAPIAPATTQLIKINPSGAIIWQKIINNTFTEDMRPTADGGYILAGSATPAAYIPMLYKLDMNGDSVWQQTYNGQPTNGLHSVTQAPDGGYVFVTEINGFAGTSPVISKTDAQGNLLTWGYGLGTTLGGITGGGYYVDYDPNGYYIATGFIDKSHPIFTVMIESAYLAKIDLAGNVLVEQTFDDWNSNIGYVVHPTTNNGYVLGGVNSSSVSSLDMGYLVKVDSMLNRPIHEFQGYVFRDNNVNCNRDTTETGLTNWIIEIRKGNQYYYTTTDTAGYYYAKLDTGAFTIKAVLNNGLWDFCVDSFSVVSANLHNSDTFDFAARALVNCSLLEVDVSTPILRRCSTSIYTANYCNTGTIDAQNAYVELSFDTTLTVLSASLPYTSGAGGIYTFNLGTIPSGDCGSFTVTTMVSCYAILGETHCVMAHIYPDSNCSTPNPLWDLSDIEVDGVCYGDSIVYKIKNIGLGNMSIPRQYFVTEDHVMLFVRPFQLNAGDSITETVLTHNGAVYRLQAQQDPFHPYSTYSALGVQMCMDATTTTANGFLGVLVQYAEDDGSPAISIDCQQNVGSYDPNDKQVFPAGYGANHYIEQNTDLEYHIRFQNTGTDTAFNIIVFDTLSEFLNPATIVPGASSHPYTWELRNSNVLVFNFNNVLLPDSNVNEAASHGFIKFRIKQDVLNPLGTIIYNSAGIVFDMNAPVVTNTTFSTVGKDFIVDVEKIGNRPNTKINVYPNPAQEQAVIQVDGAIFETLELRLMDAMGREVQYQQVQFEQKISLYRQNLSTGIYFFQLIGDGEVIGAGKVIFN